MTLLGALRRTGGTERDAHPASSRSKLARDSIPGSHRPNRACSRGSEGSLLRKAHDRRRGRDQAASSWGGSGASGERVGGSDEGQAARMPRIFEHGKLSGNTGTIVWFREQRVPGEDLSTRLRSGTLSYEELLRLALHVSDTLVAAEAVSIVHRDVKPANIIVDSHGAFWLIDFGFARHLDLDSLTPTLAPGGCGTIGYAPAEQCRNEKNDIDARSDIFALGVTLFEAAVGRNPHTEGARDAHEVLKRVSTQQLPRLESPLPRAFADLVATLAQPNIVHRCQSAREANEWIKELCDEEGVQ